MNFKELIEKKNALVDKVNEMFKGCETEKRAFNGAETAEFNKLTAEIKAIDDTMKMAEVARSFEKSVEVKAGKKVSAQDIYNTELRAFGEYLRNDVMQYRGEATDVNFTKGDNGAVIPASIANKIIETVEEICPIYAMATKFHVKGALSFPKYDESSQKVQCAYANEFTDLLSTSGVFGTVSLGGFLAGALTKISKSLINNAQFDIVSYAITKIAQAVARFLENQLLNGTEAGSKMQGVVATATATVTSGSAKAIGTDDLIDLQAQVPEVYQADACWIMHPTTFTKLKKLKDGENRYLLQDDITRGFGKAIFGKHVYVSDQMPSYDSTMNSAIKAIAYGDMSGLYVNIHEDVEIQVLREIFAPQHAIGVVAWLEMDSKVVEQQKVAVLSVKAS